MIVSIFSIKKVKFMSPKPQKSTNEDQKKIERGLFILEEISKSHIICLYSANTRHKNSG